MFREGNGHLEDISMVLDHAAHRLSSRTCRRDMILATLCAQLSALVDSVRILLTAGRATPAFGLCRGIYEIVVWLAFILDKAESTDDRSRHYKAYAARNSRKYFNHLKQSNSGVPEEFRQRIVQMSKIPGHARYLNYKLRKNPREGPDRAFMIKHVSDDQLREALKVFEAYIFRPASSPLHGGAPGAMAYLSRGGIGSTRPSRRGVEQAYVAAMSVGYVGFEQVCKHTKCKTLAGKISRPPQLDDAGASLPVW